MGIRVHVYMYQYKHARTHSCLSHSLFHSNTGCLATVEDRARVPEGRKHAVEHGLSAQLGVVCVCVCVCVSVTARRRLAHVLSARAELCARAFLLPGASWRSGGVIKYIMCRSPLRRKVRETTH